MGTYLHRHYGIDILSSLSVEIQRVIKGTTWDEEKQRPISLLGKELDEILETKEDLDYVDISFLQVTEETAKLSTPMSDKFIPHLDDTSASTFVHSLSPLSNNDKIQSCSITRITLSDVTIESRVSKIEEDCGKVKNMLKTLLNC